MAYEGKVDVDRGVMTCFHQATGMRINMYIDTPGVYFDEHLNPVPDDLAAAAGFPVEKHRKMAAKAAELAKVKKFLDEQYAIQDTRNILAERNGYILVGYDNGLATIEKEGARLTPNAGPESIVTALFNQLAGEAEAETKAQVEVKAPVASSAVPPAAPKPIVGSPAKKA